jgi:hypothetical protein
MEVNDVKDADRIRLYAKEHYVLAARSLGARRFSIPVKEPVRSLDMGRSVPAVCNALKTDKFLEDNHLRIVETVAPPSGQSTTVVYTYEFIDEELAPPGEAEENAWAGLRGALKDIFAELGGGEAYLRAERNNFYASEADGK